MSNGDKYKRKSTKKNTARLSIIVGILTILCGTTWFFIHNWKIAKMEALSDTSSLIIKFNVTTSQQFFYENSVGNEWGFKSTINGALFESSSSKEIIVYPNGIINIKACAQELDKIPDIGCSTKEVSVSSIDLVKGTNIQMDVNVTENRGRYSGHTATIPFEYNFKRVIYRGDIWERFRSNLANILQK